MGSIIRTAANNVGASGVFSSSAFNNASLNSVTSLPTAVDGKMKLILSTTASGNATRSFTSGIDSTHKTYVFKFINIHPATDDVSFQFQGSTQGASSTDGDYSNTITSTHFAAFHDEANTSANVSYETGRDLAQSSSFQTLAGRVGADADQSLSGELWLFNPSSTTYVKHFMSNLHSSYYSDYAFNQFAAGYFNTTSAINAIRFKYSSGNIDAGTIALYGIA